MTFHTVYLIFNTYSKTYSFNRHDITELLLKVALSTIKPNQTKPYSCFIRLSILPFVVYCTHKWKKDCNIVDLSCGSSNSIHVYIYKKSLKTPQGWLEGQTVIDNTLHRKQKIEKDEPHLKSVNSSAPVG